MQWTPEHKMLRDTMRKFVDSEITPYVDEWEREAVATLGLGRDDLKRVAKAAPGARRDLLVMPEELAYRSASDREAVLSFSLPSGAYATQLAREFTRLPWCTPLRPISPDPTEPE